MGFSLFPWLVEFHIVHNLPASLPYLWQGQVYKRGAPPQEGYTEQDAYNGFVIIADGGTLADKLQCMKLLKAPLGRTTEITGINAFFDYLTSRENPDGVFIYDGEHRRISRTALLSNDPPLAPDFNLAAQFPSDFIIHNHQSGRVESIDDLLPPDLKVGADPPDIGSRTRVAATYPHALQGIEGFVMKQSAYTPLGLGKVARFTSDGLAEEFFFVHDPSSAGPFVDKEHCILGVSRRYAREDGRLQKVAQVLHEPVKMRELAAHAE